MRRIAMKLAILVAPVVMAMVMGLAGCGEEHHRYYADRDREPERRDVIVVEPDRHEDHHEGDRH